MNGRTSEFHHNTPEQVRDYIVAALELVRDLEPDEDLRVSVFLQACQLISGKQVVIEQIAPVLPNMVVPRGG